MLIATTNAGKTREFVAILAGSPFQIVRPSDLDLYLEVEETGQTFVENARLKARAYFEASGVPTISEDSGLEIDALDGSPGIYSARFRGLPDGPSKNSLILELLRDVTIDRRGCRYRCAIVYIDQSGGESIFEGACAGVIAEAPAGSGGFGFDPIFLLPDRHCTMAELLEEEKNRISHRGLASRQLIAHLRRNGHDGKSA